MPPLRIHIPDFAILDHGQVVETEDKYTLLPPSTPLIDQLIPRIDACRDEKLEPSFQTPVLAVGFCALAVRWGSYFATLVDEAAPLHPDLPGDRHLQPEACSWISDFEMKRLNIEISYNIYRLVQLFRERGEAEFYRFLTKAHSHLPMPQQRIPMNRDTVALLFSSVYTGGEGVRQYERGEIPGIFNTYNNGTVESTIRRIPHHQADRFLANTLTLHGWRNTVIDDLHVGKQPVHSLQPHQRRLTRRAYSYIMRELAANFGAMIVLMDLLFDPDYRYQDLPQWPDTATAVANAYCGLSGQDWSLTDTSSMIQLYK